MHATKNYERLSEVINELHVIKDTRASFNEAENKRPFPAPDFMEIPENCRDTFDKNIYLKDNFLLDDNGRPRKLEKSDYEWIVHEWGGIKTFQIDNDDKRIRGFLDKLKPSYSFELTIKEFECISSLSKISSFLNPKEYFIYDSRAIYSINWLICTSKHDSKYFPQPTGRNTAIAKYHQQTIFNLLHKEAEYFSPKEAYSEYCRLLTELSKRLPWAEKKPYLIEMFIYAIAPTTIVEQIKSKIHIGIK